MITIKEVKTRRDIHAFAWYPQKLFRDCPYYVPMFISDEKMFFSKKNPNLSQCQIRGWLALDERGRVVGRIGGILQREHNRLSGEKFIRFSRFECINDQNVANALLDTVARWGKELGMEKMHGPWGYNDQDREGMQTFGFTERATYITNYNYEYFPVLVQNYGMKEECEWLEFRFDMWPDERDPILRIAAIAQRRLKMRDIAYDISIKEFCEKWGRKIFALLDITYGQLECYVPVPEKVVEDYLKQFRAFLNMRYISMIVDENEELIGFAIAFPSVCEALQKSKGKLLPFGFIRILRAARHPKELEWALIGVHPDYQNRGINAVMIANIIHNAQEDGILGIESDAMLTTNTEVLAQLESIAKHQVRARKCFVKDIVIEEL